MGGHYLVANCKLDNVPISGSSDHSREAYWPGQPQKPHGGGGGWLGWEAELLAAS